MAITLRATKGSALTIAEHDANHAAISNGTIPGSFTTLTTSGNAGIGVTPSAWGAGEQGFEVGTGFALNGSIGSGGAFTLTQNGYYNGANWLRKDGVSPVSQYTQLNGEIYWRTAPSGAAGSTITFTERMRISVAGAVTIPGSLSVTGVFSPQQATTAGAPTYVKGGMYFDTTVNKLRIGGATAWETVTST